jgi:hypothetical protein
MCELLSRKESCAQSEEVNWEPRSDARAPRGKSRRNNGMMERTATAFSRGLCFLVDFPFWRSSHS